MSISTIKGYLIHKQDYRDHDEIITFIDQLGKKYRCMALGVKKPTSKNGRALFVGNYCSFELFLARSNNKISKLKTCKVINSVDWRLNFFKPFNLLCECVTCANTDHPSWFRFIEWTIELFNKTQYNEQELILIILHKYCLLLGLNLQVNACVECGNKIVKTFSFKKHGMLCVNHFDPKHDRLFNLDFCKLIHLLFNGKYDELSQFHNEYDALIEQLKLYIFDQSGIKLLSI